MLYFEELWDTQMVNPGDLICLDAQGLMVEGSAHEEEFIDYVK